MYRIIKTNEKERKGSIMAKYYSETIAMRDRIARLKDDLFKKMPEIESARARLITESYRMTEANR